MNMNVKKILIHEMKNKATEQEMLFLTSDYHKWKDGLVDLLQDIDLQFSTRDPYKFAEENEYEGWRRGAIKYKHAVMTKLRAVKTKIRLLESEKAVKEMKKKDPNILETILSEVKKIGSFLHDQTPKMDQ